MVKDSTKYITIFTPTYNRAYCLPNLYKSLKAQTYRNFEWLIVDDGSIDNTEDIVQSFREENEITIRYYKTKNGGKHRAINNGVIKAKGFLFFIVDSDDYLLPNSLSLIIKQYLEIKEDSLFAGLAGLRVFPNRKQIIRKDMFSDVMDCTTLEFRYKYHIHGDLAEVYFTDILKKYPFPEIKNENFCSEALVWNRISYDGYKIRFFNKGIYVCDYLEDGLSFHSLNIRIKNPNYARLNYLEMLKYDIPKWEKFKNNINYWRFTLHSLGKKDKSINQSISFKDILCLPCSLLLYIFDYIKYRIK